MNYDHVIIVLVCLVIANIFTIAWTITKQRKFTTEDPVSQLADIADKFMRNKIMTPNELRAEIGMKPFKAENANDLRNPNLNGAKQPNNTQSSVEEMDETNG